MSTDVALSIVICTRNRSRLLGQAIGSLLTQAFDPTHYEVLIIDDNSTDRTPETAHELMVNHPHISYHKSPSRGLPTARIHGAAKARGRVIGYLDDDAKACTDWLERADTIAQQFDPICFGGPFFAFYETPKPVWFRDKYGSVTHGDQARHLNDDEFLCGGNIFFRRNALEAAGGFDSAFSNPQDRFTYGEEGVPQIRLRRKFPGQAFYYDPALSILHLVRPERMHLARGVREAFEAGRGYGKLMLQGREETRRFPFLRRMACHYIRFGAKSLFGTFLRNRQLYPHWQNYIYEHAAREMRNAGMFYEQYLSAARARSKSSVQIPPP